MAGQPSLRESARAALGALELLPPIRSLRRWDYERRRFARTPDAYRGIYPTFDAARRAAPGRTGYDHPEMAAMYDERAERVYPNDYPVLFWLQRILRPGIRIFDFGGHVGITYHGFRGYLDYPPDLRWVVCDLPAITDHGTALAQRRDSPGLSFTNRFEDAAGADVLLALGSLQYMESDLEVLLGRLSRLPGHLILNRTPLVEGEPYVTLQNTAYSYNPYRVFNRRALVDALTGVGYELVDSWLNWELKVRVPYHGREDVDHYSGLYMRLKAGSPEPRPKAGPTGGDRHAGEGGRRH